MTVRQREGEPEIVILPDADAAAEVAARRIAAALDEAGRQRDRADWATTGGSAPAAVYRHLESRALRRAAPWGRVHLWWGDDRHVPRDHPLSNVRLADQILLGGTRYADGAGEAGSLADPHPDHRPAGVPIPVEQVHPFPTGEALAERHGAAWCAARYVRELRASAIAVSEGWPVFDVAFLGVGPDGHLLSVFPGSRAFDSDEWAIAIPAPTHVEPHVERVTLNPAILDVARLVLIVAHGESKAPILTQLFGPDRDPRRLPAQLARRPGAVWILDTAAAAGLPDEIRHAAAPAG